MPAGKVVTAAAPGAALAEAAPAPPPGAAPPAGAVSAAQLAGAANPPTDDAWLATPASNGAPPAPDAPTGPARTGGRRKSAQPARSEPSGAQSLGAVSHGTVAPQRCPGEQTRRTAPKRIHLLYSDEAAVIQRSRDETKLSKLGQLIDDDAPIDVKC